MTVLITSLDRTRTTAVKLTTTNATAVYTVPSTVAMATGVKMKLCNVDATAAVDVTIEWFDFSANVAYRLLSTYPLAADSLPIDFDLIGIALDPSDEIRVTAGAADDLHVVTTVLEAFGRGANLR